MSFNLILIRKRKKLETGFKRGKTENINFKQKRNKVADLPGRMFGCAPRAKPDADLTGTPSKHANNKKGRYQIRIRNAY